MKDRGRSAIALESSGRTNPLAGHPTLYTPSVEFLFDSVVSVFAWWAHVFAISGTCIFPIGPNRDFFEVI